MTERAGVQGNPVTQHTIPAAEPGPPLGTLHHVELWVPDGFEVELVATET